MSEPRQKRYASKQDYETPWQVVRALERRFGPFAVDLAASAQNKKAPLCFTEADNSLAQDWHKIGGVCWLNPPFANIAPWADKCAYESEAGAKIVMLTPASVSTDWFMRHVHGVARVVFLRPRITFVGADTPYPKDLMLTLWGVEEPGYEPWSWATQPSLFEVPHDPR